MYKPQNVKQRNIILDIDDVMVDCSGLLCKHFNTIGSQAKVEDYKEFNFPQYHGLTLEDLTRVINEEDVFLNVSLFSGVKDAINKLIANGYGVHLVTSRGAYEDAYEKTLKFLFDSRINFDTLSVVDSTCEKKSSAYKHLIDISNEIFIIDDNLDNLIDAHEHDICAVCIDRPWNANCPSHLDSGNLWRFKSLPDAVDAILK
ncbi:hypothetical protein [Photobacterium damselae]|uniref:hypothetical protein n=1 Tax=Photobacterium damselae TaxID=38293 RepID=UPI004068BD25